MPWRQIERFPCCCHAFVCAATFALDLIKSKQTRTHSYTPHSHTEWWNWQKFVWIRERQRTWKSGREKESLGWGGQRPWAPSDDFFLLLTSETKQIKYRGHQTSALSRDSAHFWWPIYQIPVFYCAFKTAGKVKCNSERKVKQHSCRFCFSHVVFVLTNRVCCYCASSFIIFFLWSSCFCNQWVKVF